MPVDTRIDVPFLPQTGITSQILQAIQLANEHHHQGMQEQLAQSQQGIQQQTATAQAEEAKARAGFYGSEAAKNQMQTDMMKRTQAMLGGGPDQATAQSQDGSWLPSNTPKQLTPFVNVMIPKDLNDQEKTVVEAGAQAGRMKAMSTGNLGDYLNEIRSGVDSVVTARNQRTKNPENEPISDSERQNFLKNTLPSMENLGTGQQKLAQSAVAGAKTHKDLDTLQSRLMAQDNQALTAKIAEANRISNASMQHNLQLDTDGRNNIIKNNTKWSDAQTQIELGNKTIQAAKTGDDLATRLLPTMEVLGINMSAGIKRISPVEAEAAQIPASWTNRFNAWVDKRTSGSTPEELLKDGKRLFNDLADARYSSYLAEQKSVADNFKMGHKDVTVIDSNGQSVTLDKALKGTKPETAGGNVKVSTIPSNVGSALKDVGPGIHTLSDGSAWQKNPDGSIVRVQ